MSMDLKARAVLKMPAAGSDRATLTYTLGARHCGPARTAATQVTRIDG